MRPIQYLMIPLLTATCTLALACSKPEALVEEGTEVDLTYEAKLADGTMIDRSPESGPITFVVGAGGIQPLVERALVGLRRGEEKTFDVADAYGPYDPNKTGNLRADAIPEGTKVGDKMMMAGGLSATIKEIGDKIVIMDLNHPFAGKVVTFTVKVEDVRKPKES